MNIYTGTSGYSYKEWKGIFYPEKLPANKMLGFYATELPVIPLYFRADPYILPKWLKGVEPTGHQDISSLWVENWRAEGR